MFNWEVYYLVEFQPYVDREVEVGWLVVEALFEQVARKVAWGIVMDAYAQEHWSPGDYRVRCQQAIKLGPCDEVIAN